MTNVQCSCLFIVVDKDLTGALHLSGLLIKKKIQNIESNLSGLTDLTGYSFIFSFCVIHLIVLDDDAARLQKGVTNKIPGEGLRQVLIKHCPPQFFFQIKFCTYRSTTTFLTSPVV